MNETTRFLKVLSDVNRLRILMLLQRESMCVCELAYVLGISQPAVSRHLKRIREAGLISDRRQGFWTHYVFESPPPKYAAVLEAVFRTVGKDSPARDDWKKFRSADRAVICRTSAATAAKKSKKRNRKLIS